MDSALNRVDKPTYLNPDRNKNNGRVDAWYFVAEDGWYRAFVTACEKTASADNTTDVVNPTHNQFCGALLGKY
jgi:hypothetical protein